MRRHYLTVVLCAFSCFAQTSGAGPTQAQLTKLLTFEDEHSSRMPAGWGGGPADTITADNNIVHSGSWSVRLERNASSTQSFSTVTKVIPINFAGSRIELRGYLRTEGVTDFAGLWMREDGDTPGLAFDNMQSRGLNGTTDWTEYSITLPLHPDAMQLYFGVLVSGSGKTWADDLQLLVDGKPIWEAPPRKEPDTVLSKDHEFDGGSKITLNELNPAQIANLTLLGKVWGFLKYHHPRVRAGEVHWDYELFRVLPSILNATGNAQVRKELLEWVTRTGMPKECTQCTTLKVDDLHLHPELKWLSDNRMLGTELSNLLQSVHRNRPAEGKQFFVTRAPGVGNPIFNRELPYKEIALTDPGYQLLALFRFWNIIEYWFPYRDVIGENWDGVLREFIPRVALAKTRDSYQLELMALIARVHDTHANLWSSLGVRPPRGTCQVPVKIRFLGQLAVVNGSIEGSKSLLEPGDIIESLDGVPVKRLIADWAPYYAASNEPTRLRDIARSLTRGECVDALLKVQRGEQMLDVRAPRVPQSSLKMSLWNDRPGQTFQKLGNDVAYLKLSSIQADNAASYVEAAAGTKGLVIDIRNYPASFSVFTLGSLLVEKPTTFARFTIGDLQNPGAFRWTEPLALQPGKPRYEGKVIILVDEVSQSSAEYTAMAFRASSRATVVGSTTAAADGNVSQIPLPGGLRTMISGIGVFYPDKRPTQRIGIIPDVEMRPTVEGIRAGRDEVLEKGLRLILGEDVPQAEIEKLARH